MIVQATAVAEKTVDSTAQPQLQTREETAAAGKTEDKQSVAGEPYVVELTEDFQKMAKIMHDLGLKFEVHQDTGRLMVTVTNEETGEVIREIPSSEMLEFAAELKAMIEEQLDKTGRS